MSLERRTLLKGAAAALAAGPFAGFVAAPVAARPAPRPMDLHPVKDLRDGRVRLHLPRGFNYRSLHDTEFPVTLHDGSRLPGRHDGMGAFAGPDDSVILVRNHEVAGPGTPMGAGPWYDSAAQGGTSTVRVTKQGEVLDSRVSLGGTMMNCSGGIMPWGAWVTCEETVNGPDVGPDFTGVPNTALTRPHGYVFEVPLEGEATREPITRAGRFAHEAVSFDPEDGILYLTEDNFGFPSGFYRYRPATDPMRTGRLDDEGTLEMLAVTGVPNAHLEAHQEQGVEYQVSWVPIADPDPTFPAGTTNDQAINAVGDQGRALGAALFSRCEGQVYDDGVVYFTATQGGGAPEAYPAASDQSGFGRGHGQVWAYDTRREVLTCVYQSPEDTDPEQPLDFPDNVTTSPRGTLVVCEDSSGSNYLRGLTTEGRIFDIGLNRLVSQTRTNPDGSPVTRYGDEFAGSTFSPDGHTLFVNIQASAGMTFAIWGPWRSIGV